MEMYKLFKQKIDSLSKSEINALWENVESYSKVGPLASKMVYSWSKNPENYLPPNEGLEENWNNNKKASIYSEPFLFSC